MRLRTSRRFSTQMKQSLQRLEGESLKEYSMLRERKALLAPVELDSVESDAVVAKGKLILCLKSIENDAGGQIKAKRRRAARLVVSGRVNGRGTHRTRESGGVRTGDRKQRFDCSLSTSGAGNLKHYITIPECLRRVMPRGRERERATFDKLRRPVCVQRSCVRFCQIWSRLHHEFRCLADHEQVAHGSRSSGVTCCGMVETTLVRSNVQ